MYKLLYVLIIMLFAFCESQNDRSPIHSGDAVNTNPVYEKYCASCHGAKLQKFRNNDWSESYTNTELKQIIAEGMPNKGMPAFGSVIAEEDLSELIDFIKNYDFSDSEASIPEQAKDYEIEVMADGLGVPWGMAFLPNGDMLIAEREGKLKRLDAEGELHSIEGLPAVRARGQGGLMDLRLHPDYERNGWLYISYSYIDERDSRAGNTAIIRAQLEGDRLTQIEQIYRGIPAVRTNHHFGSRMAFDDEAYLWFTNGDRGRRDEFPQKLDNSNGKIHRLHDDGRVPDDNPFVGREDAVPSIYSYGHRNPQGIAIHPVTGEVWAHEHGPRGGDEINIIEKGGNYGWPVISYGINYNGTRFTDLTEKEGMLQPVHYYDPSIAPCGMAYVHGGLYPAG